MHTTRVYAVFTVDAVELLLSVCTVFRTPWSDSIRKLGEGGGGGGGEGGRGGGGGEGGGGIFVTIPTLALTFLASSLQKRRRKGRPSHLLSWY